MFEATACAFREPAEHDELLCSFRFTDRGFERALVESDDPGGLAHQRDDVLAFSTEHIN